METTAPNPLAEHLCREADAVLLIDALPGTGRRRLLAAAADVMAARGGMVFDLSPEHHPVLAPDGSAAFCARADQLENAAALRRAGRLKEAGNRELFLAPLADPHFEDSGGWPVLSGQLARAPQDAAALTALARDLLAQSPAAIRGAVVQLCRTEDGLEDAALAAEQRALLHWLDPLAECRGGIWRLRTRGLARLLRQVTRDWPSAEAPWQPPASPVPQDRIAALLRAGERGEALVLLRQEGGHYFMHIHGMEAGQAVADAFGSDPAPDVMALSFLIAVKSGDIERAAYVLSQYENGALLDLEKRLQRSQEVPVPLAFCRIELAIFRGETRRHHIMDEASELLARTDPRAHLVRGGIYNLLLDYHIRGERFAAAEEAAARALRHYEAAEAPYLRFFIHLHRSVNKLRMGEPSASGQHLPRAEKALALTPFEIPQDARFLALLRAVAAYETGDPMPMVGFAETAFHGFAYGEIWP